MVSAILTVKCGASLAALTCTTMAAYMAFTFSVTQVSATLDTASVEAAAQRLPEGQPGDECFSLVAGMPHFNARGAGCDSEMPRPPLPDATSPRNQPTIQSTHPSSSPVAH